ncbi:MAG: T9SS type A sorting domain-containing protein [Bacteroidetes bacterium]|nr:MAG: T9SS type A sorting domain-containing protein [Bacteroidota bacterium]
MKKFLWSLCFLSLISTQIRAQNCQDLQLEAQAEIPSTCNAIAMTMLQDRAGQPFLYVANKEAGLKIYDITNPTSPQFVNEVPPGLLDSLHVMNLAQEGNYLYLALGNFFNSNQASGMAIIDISAPLFPVVSDLWKLEGSIGGSGIIVPAGDVAYLGAMGNGVVALDVSDKANVQLLGQFAPDINFPDANADPEKVNARGMAVRNDTIYLAYDAGGLRIIDATKPNQMTEIGRYANPTLNGKPRAYNNLVLDGELVYITIDYCGLEVLDVSNPGNITLTGWWNPYGCPDNNWFTSPSHTNEIKFLEGCQKLFISTGKSDLVVVDVGDPSQPDSCFTYGGVDNGIGTWGVDLWEDQVYLSYVCSFIPFSSNWTGVKSAKLSGCFLANPEAGFLETPEPEIFPNPADQIITMNGKSIEHVSIFDAQGKLIMQTSYPEAQSINVPVHFLSEGLYYLEIEEQRQIYRQKIFISH